MSIIVEKVCEYYLTTPTGVTCLSSFGIICIIILAMLGFLFILGSMIVLGNRGD